MCFPFCPFPVHVFILSECIFLKKSVQLYILYSSCQFSTLVCGFVQTVLDKTTSARVVCRVCKWEKHERRAASYSAALLVLFSQDITFTVEQITFLHLLAMHVTLECSQSLRETEIFRLIISKSGIFDLNRGMCLLTKPLIRSHFVFNRVILTCLSCSRLLSY